MEPEAALLASLRRAVAAMPDDAGLRLHLAGLLVDAGHREEAIRHLGAIVHADPGNAAALRLLLRASAGGAAAPAAAGAFDGASAETEFSESVPPMFITSGDAAGAAAAPVPDAGEAE